MCATYERNLTNEEEPSAGGGVEVAEVDAFRGTVQKKGRDRQTDRPRDPQAKTGIV